MLHFKVLRFIKGGTYSDLSAHKAPLLSGQLLSVEIR